MNHTYRLVWNDQSQRHVPAPESARGRGKAGGKVLKAAALVLAAAFALPAAAQQALLSPTALPSGGSVVAGQAGIAQSGSQMTITQSSDKAILHWQGFDIGANAAVRFDQPSASAIALNRVIAGDASHINGQLSANGQLWLINPNGVVFGVGSKVDVGGLVASALDTTNEDFLAGKAVFRRGTATGGIENHGAITAADGGLVALLAPTVSNDGIVSARLGNLLLAGGDKITLAAGADGNLQVAVDPATVRTLIENKQLIVADGGQVVMTGKAADTLSAGVVANHGTVQARTIAEREGRILLLADMAHGEVIHSGLLDASAPNAGNGGFVETSAAKVTLEAGRRVTTKSENGQTGTWLIDPNDYTIAASGGDITGADLSTDLASTSVEILSSSGAASGNGDIFVNDAVTWSANRLTLSAIRNIDINANLNGSGTAQLALAYGQGALASGNTADYRIASGAKVDLPAGNNFSTQLGSDAAPTNYNVITSLGAQGSTTGTDLQGMNGNLAGNYALGADIDASTTSGWNSNSGWEPIGDYENPFDGYFAGLGHQISGLTSNGLMTSDGRTSDSLMSALRPWGLGLFGYTRDAMIRDIGLLGGSISGASDVGGLVGHQTYGTINNSYSSVSIIGSNLGVTYSWLGNDRLGGLVGTNNSGGIVNSHSSGNVVSLGSGFAGGLVGQNSGTIEASSATGNVNGGSEIGGLVGYNSGSVRGSHASGDVTGNYKLGGLVGSNGNEGEIINSYANGAIHGYGDDVGGLVGENFGVIRNAYATGTVSGFASIGGLVGDNFGELINSYATGSVSGTKHVGGLVGWNREQGLVNNSYYPIDSVAIAIDGVPQDSNFISVGGLRKVQWADWFSDQTLRASDYYTINNGRYQIGTLEDFENILGFAGANLNFDLNADIAVYAGFHVPYFNGYFYGNGHMVSGLYLNQPGQQAQGMFGVLASDSGVFGLGVNGSVTGYYHVGGLVGFNAGEIRNSYAAVSVVGGGSSYYLGGLVGGNVGKISSSFTTGKVSDGVDVGGLVGLNEGAIINSYAMANVSGGQYSVGGLVGVNIGEVENSYAAGSVSSAFYLGGLVGRNWGTVSNSFWDITASGQVGSDGGVGLTTVEMQRLANFNSATFANGDINPAWDISGGVGTTVWRIDDGIGYPVLRDLQENYAVTPALTDKSVPEGGGVWLVGNAQLKPEASSFMSLSGIDSGAPTMSGMPFLNLAPGFIQLDRE
jgi:trimeric autotransporter adhesin